MGEEQENEADVWLESILFKSFKAENIPVSQNNLNS
jgi:hypothetical protein